LDESLWLTHSWNSTQHPSYSVSRWHWVWSHNDRERPRTSDEAVYRLHIVVTNWNFLDTLYVTASPWIKFAHTVWQKYIWLWSSLW